MVNKKSAKDIAFDKERAKFRHEINELKRTNKLLLDKINDLSAHERKLVEANLELMDENAMLKKASTVSSEELKLLTEEAKHSKVLREKLSDLFSFGKVTVVVDDNNFLK